MDAAGSRHRAVGDGDVFAVAVAAVAAVAAADAGTTPTTGSVHRAVGDLDVFADATITAADAGTTVATLSSHRAAFDGDVFAAAVVASAVVAAADAGTTPTTGSIHPAAGDGDVFAAAVVAAADASTIFASGGLQAAAAGFFIVLQGQRACGGGGVFFKARPLNAAFQLVIAVQLDLHIALSLNAQGGFSFYPIASGVAHIDLHVFQGEVQHRIGKVVDQRNGVAPKAVSLIVLRGRGRRGRGRGCLQGLGRLVGILRLISAFRLVSALRLVCILRPVSVLRLVGIFRFLSVLLPVGVLRPVSVLRLVGTLRLVCAFRLLGVLRLGRGSRLVVVLHYRAKAGVLCCRAFQVALQRGDGLFMGGDDGLLPGRIHTDLRSVLFDFLSAIIHFGDGNIAAVDIVGPCKGRSRQRHRDAQRCQQSCCPAECVGLPHGRGLLSFLRFLWFLHFLLYPPPLQFWQSGKTAKFRA